MNDSNLPFRDRSEAGRHLARVLERYRSQQPIVLGLPRGGVVVAYEVARALDAPLDVVVARKLGAPFQPEMAIGAIAPGGVVFLQGRFGMTDEQIQWLVAREAAEMERRLRRFRGSSDLPDVAGRTVLLIDDGLATGLTAAAAVQALRTQWPRRIVLAVPVGAAETVERLRERVDELVCLSTPEDFVAVGQWYVDFEPVSEEEVLALLAQARRAARPRRPGSARATSASEEAP